MALQKSLEDRFGNLYPEAYHQIGAYSWSRDGGNKKYFVTVNCFKDQKARDGGKDVIDGKSFIFDDNERITEKVETIFETEVPLEKGEVIEVMEGMPQPKTKIEYSSTYETKVLQEGTTAEIQKCDNIITFFYNKLKEKEDFIDSIDV
jgi:hypothetical protein